MVPSEETIQARPITNTYLPPPCVSHHLATHRCLLIVAASVIHLQNNLLWPNECDVMRAGHNYCLHGARYHLVNLGDLTLWTKGMGVSATYTVTVSVLRQTWASQTGKVAPSHCGGSSLVIAPPLYYTIVFLSMSFMYISLYL